MNVSPRLTGTPLKAFMVLCCLVAVLAVTPVRATVVDIQATITGNVLVSVSIDSSYSKYYSGLSYGLTSYHGHALDFRAFLKFGMDTLPDTCVLVSAELGYYQYQHDEHLPQVQIKLIPDPVPLGAADLFRKIGSARALTPGMQSPDGWMAWSFDSAAVALFDSCRGTDWVSLAISRTGSYGYGRAYGYDSTPPPCLRIEYAASGTQEPQGTVARQPELTLAPNPTAGRFIKAQYNVAANTSGKLALRDVLGRVVKSFTLDPSGSTRLDLRGFAPGVYVATLNAAGQSVTRKLVVTPR